jgi:N-acetylmuramoyl-L-alanine amidase CwlA
VDNNLQASAHFVVKDDVVINCIPTTEVAWHCGSKGNYTSIGIEVIPANAMGQFSEDSIESIKQIITRWSKLQLLRHFDWTGKDCPRYYTDIVDLVGADGRVENPVGGTDRWKKLVEELRGENNGSNT